jgi:hypothetical protein
LNTLKFILDNRIFGRIVYLNVFKIISIRGVIMNVAACYFSYLAISIGLTVWVARTLHQSGRIFLVDAFHGNAELADSVNHLLVVGFYLINIGYIAMALTTHSPMANFRQIIELESVKIGVVLLILGAMHFFNILVFAKMRHRATGGAIPPPPQMIRQY